MKTIVLDDDPTGTQSATGATVLLDLAEETLAADLGDVLSREDAVYVQTNSRALPEPEAVALARRVREAGLGFSREAGEPVRFVLRGDSTLRGHVFAETAVFLEDPSASEEAVMLFVPAFPDGGRTTRGGMHYVRVDGEDVPAHETEYADDPVFGFTTGRLEDYVREASGRPSTVVPLDEVRAGAVEAALLDAAPGGVVLPDAVTEEDIVQIARAVDAAADRGARIVVRSASPLAAHLAGVASDGLLPLPLTAPEGDVLLVCGSHTAGATAQLRALAPTFGSPTLVDTEAALDDPSAAGHDAARRTADVALARRAMPGSPADTSPAALLLSTQRERSSRHGTLDHGERIMAALTTAVADLLPHVGAVVAKGGITSAEVARTGIGARTAHVLGQILPGVSAWRLTAGDGRELLYVVVPGNVGGDDTLVRALSAIGMDGGDVPAARDGDGASGA
jgi:uncharacterized protein YgbK (DUF1537 family)